MVVKLSTLMPVGNEADGINADCSVLAESVGVMLSCGCACAADVPRHRITAPPTDKKLRIMVMIVLQSRKGTERVPISIGHFNAPFPILGFVRANHPPSLSRSSLRERCYVTFDGHIPKV
jgi:hypothetical protein